MILCIDAGNTRIKWGLLPGATQPARAGSWLDQGTVEVKQAHRLAALLPAQPVRRAVVANVAGEAAAAHIRAALAGHAQAVHWVIGHERQCGVTSLYANPAQLGADRWAALIGARALHEGACIVVNSGTATTIDVLDAAGVFHGGLILPGMRMMRAALNRDTAQLSETEGQFEAYPRSTADAIFSGAIQAHLGAIERMFAAIAGEPGALCLVSGGAGRVLHERLELPRRYVDNLALEGLAVIACAPEE